MEAAKTVKRPPQQPAQPWCANYWAPLMHKRHPLQPAQPRYTNDGAPRTQKQHQQEHRPQQPTKRSDLTQHAKGRMGDCPGPHKETATRRNVTRGGGGLAGGNPTPTLHPSLPLARSGEGRLPASTTKASHSASDTVAWLSCRCIRGLVCTHSFLAACSQNLPIPSTSPQVLPPYHGKLYRGINTCFDENSYRAGQRVCWSSFSSASSMRSVAEEFAKGERGSLFFLTSATARAIDRVSRFPEEAEVLFRPNTVFNITSTLYGTSDIGSFYSPVDNIAMEEVACAPAAVTSDGGVLVRSADTSSIVLQVPRPLSTHVLSQVCSLEDVVVDSVTVSDDTQGAVAATVVLAQQGQWDPQQVGSPMRDMSVDSNFLRAPVASHILLADDDLFMHSDPQCLWMSGNA